MQATNRLCSPHYGCSAASRAVPIDCSPIDYAGSWALVSVRCLPQDDQQTRMLEPMPPTPRVPIVECRRQLLTWFKPQVLPQKPLLWHAETSAAAEVVLVRQPTAALHLPQGKRQPGDAHKYTAGIHPHEKRNLIVVDGSYLNAMFIDIYLHATVGTRRPCDNCLFVCLFCFLLGPNSRRSQRRRQVSHSFEFIERWHTRDQGVVDISRSARLSRCRLPSMREPMFPLHHP
jgi:hypothetical protein